MDLPLSRLAVFEGLTDAEDQPAIYGFQVTHDVSGGHEQTTLVKEKRASHDALHFRCAALPHLNYRPNVFTNIREFHSFLHIPALK